MSITSSRHKIGKKTKLLIQLIFRKHVINCTQSTMLVKDFGKNHYPTYGSMMFKLLNYGVFMIASLHFMYEIWGKYYTNVFMGQLIPIFGCMV